MAGAGHVAAGDSAEADPPKTEGGEMPQSPMRLIKRFTEFIPQEEVNTVPAKRRGLYVLYRFKREQGKAWYDVVYVGMTTSGIKGRLRSHRKTKGESWTHFSAFEVWDNIRDDEIVELEGLIRHFYRKDTKANMLNVQKKYRMLSGVRSRNLDEWRK